MHSDLFPFYGRIGIKLLTFQVRLVHIHSTDLVIVIGGVVVDSLTRIAAGGVERDFVMPLTDLTAAALL